MFFTPQTFSRGYFILLHNLFHRALHEGGVQWEPGVKHFQQFPKIVYFPQQIKLQEMISMCDWEMIYKKNMVMLIRSTANPSYCPSTILPIRPTATSDLRQLQVGWAYLFAHPTYSAAYFVMPRSRVEIINCSCRTPLNFVGQMVTFCRSDGHFSQVGWALCVGRMHQYALFNMPIRPKVHRTLAVITKCLKVGWAVEGMGVGPKIHHPIGLLLHLQL